MYNELRDIYPIEDFENMIRNTFTKMVDSEELDEFLSSQEEVIRKDYNLAIHRIDRNYKAEPYQIMREYAKTTAYMLYTLY